MNSELLELFKSLRKSNDFRGADKRAKAYKLIAWYWINLQIERIEEENDIVTLVVRELYFFEITIYHRLKSVNVWLLATK